MATNTKKKPEKGKFVTVLVDPRLNNGEDEALGLIVKAWNDEMVNVRVFVDGEETLWMPSVTVIDGRPEEPSEDDEKAEEYVPPKRVCWLN